ncbi:MAG: HAMP domain-containing sensor histidine kinase, partial [Tannerellaceae bacterium]
MMKEQNRYWKLWRCLRIILPVLLTLCPIVLCAGEQETAVMNDVIEAYRKASRSDNKEDLVRCSESLGMIYHSISRDSDAVLTLQEGLDLLELINGKLETRLHMTFLQLKCCVHTEQFDQMKVIAARYEALIREQEDRNKNEGENYPVERDRCLLTCYQAEMALLQNNPNGVGQALTEVGKYISIHQLEDDPVQNVYLYVLADYYRHIGELDKALSLVNKLLKREAPVDNLQLKADILKRLGRQDELLAVYDLIYEVESKKSDEAFFRQINQLRTLHDLKKSELQSHELQLRNQQVIQKQRMLVFSFIVLLSLFVMLIVMFISYRKMRLLRNELLMDKLLLIDSEDMLVQAKKKAEEDSRMKSTFVANMSHEIRTPLNAIVGFSSLLVDDSTSPEEKIEYSEIIKNNTQLMLNLVDDVLNLSQIGNQKLHFEMKRSLLIDCCRHALDSIRHRVSEGVLLTFAPSSEQIALYTDTLRLQQLLINLLSNATKFTDKGEINLSYTLTGNKKYVRIIVTDTGVGIPLEKQSSIFQRFEKLDEYKPGVGLGLSICRVISAQLGGNLYLDSTYTEGAR